MYVCSHALDAMSLNSEGSSKVTKLPQIDMKKITPADRDNYFGHQVGDIFCM
jgi:hypothetical protein